MNLIATIVSELKLSQSDAERLITAMNNWAFKNRHGHQFLRRCR